MAAVKQGQFGKCRHMIWSVIYKSWIIGLPDDLQTLKSLHVEVADAKRISAILPVRRGDSHKGTFGTALIAAGSVNYTGAALLAGQAAYRIGTGLVTLAGSIIDPWNSWRSIS